jgi:hypothetical protein
VSHFDDIDDLPRIVPSGLVGFAIVVAAIVWAFAADQQSAEECLKHGEKYVDSRTGYTLCEQDGGTVVRR